MTIQRSHTAANIEQEEPETNHFYVADINASGSVSVGSTDVNLYTHFDRDVSLDRFEEILVDLLEWTRQRQTELGLQGATPLFPRP